MILLEVELAGQKVRVRAQRIGGTLWLHHNGRTFCYQPEVQLQRRGSTPLSATASGEIRAPMPGKVMKISASAGQAVKAGSVIVVIEAMKMEYSLETPIQGTVRNIKCQLGDQVSLGQVLAEVLPGEVLQAKEVEK